MMSEKADITDRLMRVEEVAEMLQLAPSTVYRLAAEGLMPSLKVCGVRRFSRPAILSWLETKDENRRRNRRRTVDSERP